MNSEKTYHCLCGQEFTTPNKFNAHKRNCETHLRNKYGDEYEAFMQSWINRRTKNSGKTQHNQSVYRKQQELQQWISEEHKCQRCGIIMTEKFGSGKFCSRKCANSRCFTEEAIAKKSKSAKDAKFYQCTANLENYFRNPKLCVMCSSILPYEFRFRKTCSDDCKYKLLRKRELESYSKAGYKEKCTQRKHGYYKGFHCDSSWELAYVIYNLDHNIQFSECSLCFLYVDVADSIHKYYPDFIEDGYIIEIKGQMNDNVYRKISAVDNYPVKLLTYSDIKPMIEYVQKTYNVKDISELYD